MQIENLIRERRTVHSYKDQSIDESLLKKALELALFAPNHKHTMPWIFFRLGKSVRQKVKDLAIELKAKKAGAELSKPMIQSLTAKFLNPAELIVMGQKNCESDFQKKEDYASIACGVQNISLFLWSHGIGTKWSTGEVTRDPKIYEWIGRSPDEVLLEGFLWVGIAEDLTKRPPKATLENCFFETE